MIEYIPRPKEYESLFRVRDRKIRKLRRLAEEIMQETRDIQDLNDMEELDKWNKKGNDLECLIYYLEQSWVGFSMGVRVYPFNAS